MKKKIISIVIIILAIGAFIANHLITYARIEEGPIYVNLSQTDLNGVGYGIGTPSSGGKYIWNIITYDSIDATTASTKQRNLYCIKADYGQTWFDNQKVTDIVEYNLCYDMQLDRTELLGELEGDTTDGVVEALLTPGGGQYEQLLWLLDNSYIEGVTDKTKYLESVGIYQSKNGNITTYYSETETFGTSELTDEDIEAIQKMAIWYFTNGKDNATIYDKTDDGNTQWLTIIQPSQDGYITLSKVDADSSRNKQANYLYRYLINGAQNGAEQYTASDDGVYQRNGAPVSINGITSDKTETIKTTRKDGNYLIGPIIIEENNDLGYNLETVITDQSGNELDETEYTYTDAEGNLLDEEELIGRTEGFYICVPRSSIESISITINVSYMTTTKKLWLQGEEDDNGNITLTGEQPLVEVIQNPDGFTVELISQPEEFDLALRKYITAVHNKDGEEKEIANARNLDTISVEPLLQTGTTANYKHRKDPVVVEDEDIVTYTLRIYNEGNKNGYASKIIDQLPTGLTLPSIAPITSVDKNGNAKNTYNVEYSSSTNTITLTLDTEKSENPGLQPFTATTGLDYETIEIRCKVTQTPDTKEQIVLTNIAWIAQAIDSETGELAIDRDSKPEDAPNATKDNMTDYRGTTTEEESSLENAEFYFKGQEDDDDFEKLVINPVVKKFDLALFKHIAAVSKDPIIEDGEYITDTGNADGKYLRAPEVTAIDSETGKITYRYEENAKEPLIVEPGDYVLYTIRVYNEGEVDGYVNKIKDTLPKGLILADADIPADKQSEVAYYGIWNVEGVSEEGGQIVTTDNFAEGKGADELTPGSNLLKALNKEGQISEENPDYIDAQILCRVEEDATPDDGILTNFAQISDDSDDDIDSTPDEWKGEDDEDTEKIKLQYFDLSLRKFITSVNGNAPETSREPVVDTSKLADEKETTTAIYTHTKQPLGVQIGDKIVYTIRVYNEGDINGYASEVKDYLPEYLTYVEDSEINTKYKWQISEDGRVATTTYLATTELQAFNGTELDYADLKIECIVSESAPLAEKQTNIAEISEYTYNGSTVPNDIDSTADNMENKIPADENLPTYKDDEINNSYVPGNEDDDDFEKVYVKTFDLSLRKFVDSVNGESLNGAREPKVDVTPLKDGTGTTAIYKHPKTPVALKIGDKVIYTIRVYNEGETAGYANEVKDYLPPYLEYVEDSSINNKYGWSISDDGRIATTTYLSNKEISEFNGTTLDYEDIQIECRITDNAIPDESITNIAEISEYKYGETVVTEDIDSESDNIDENLPEDKELPNYKKDQENESYVPGNEDDDDFEKVYVKEFDLALRKFITQIQGTEVTTRVPQVKIENGTISYEHSKDALTVHVGDVVVYTLRIYNEGEIDGYASEITDDIPEYLEYLPEDSTNVEYMWKMYDKNGNETENIENAVKVKTQYLSKENGEDNLLKAFDGETLSYKDIKIAFKVKDPNSNTFIITNYAQISDDTDEDGNEIKDKDSETGKWNEGEDDQDIENVKVEYFDLSILKFVSKVIIQENGVEKITETGYNGHENPEPVVKVELHKKKLDDVVVKFAYGITVTNEGDMPGYATEITDYVPEGLRFEASDNPKWTDEGNNVISTKQLENTLLQPGESETIEVTLTWINGSENLALKTNTVEISDDKNEYDVPDRDSTPDNKQDGEDDIDIAKVILAITTGSEKTYFMLTLGLLAVIATGVGLIKKFVV